MVFFRVDQLYVVHFFFDGYMYISNFSFYAVSGEEEPAGDAGDEWGSMGKGYVKTSNKHKSHFSMGHSNERNKETFRRLGY